MKFLSSYCAVLYLCRQVVQECRLSEVPPDLDGSHLFPLWSHSQVAFHLRVSSFSQTLTQELLLLYAGYPNKNKHKKEFDDIVYYSCRDHFVTCHHCRRFICRHYGTMCISVGHDNQRQRRHVVPAFFPSMSTVVVVDVSMPYASFTVGSAAFLLPYISARDGRAIHPRSQGWLPFLCASRMTR